jgi:hypothetical protein
MKIVVMEHLNVILFRKSGHANKQHSNHMTTATYSYEGLNHEFRINCFKGKMPIAALN